MVSISWTRQYFRSQLVFKQLERSIREYERIPSWQRPAEVSCPLLLSPTIHPVPWILLDTINNLDKWTEMSVSQCNHIIYSSKPFCLFHWNHLQKHIVIGFPIFLSIFSYFDDSCPVTVRQTVNSKGILPAAEIYSDCIVGTMTDIFYNCRYC